MYNLRGDSKMENEIKKSEVEVTEGEERGASMVEYALLLALIAVVCILGITVIGQQASAKFSSIASGISVAG